MQRVHVPPWLRPKASQKASRQNTAGKHLYERELEGPKVLESSLFRGF
jgi:hypothetical protein